MKWVRRIHKDYINLKLKHSKIDIWFWFLKVSTCFKHLQHLGGTQQPVLIEGRKASLSLSLT